jgi:hypothetical protein
MEIKDGKTVRVNLRVNLEEISKQTTDKKDWKTLCSLTALRQVRLLVERTRMSELRMENRRHASASMALYALWQPMHYTLKADA